eukprot:gene38741-52328_t
MTLRLDQQHIDDALEAVGAAARGKGRDRDRLREDIRLLGRILGDTVRDQEGAAVFDLVENIRKTSVRFHRDEDKLARGELETILDGMSTAETVRIVRAFSYFSHLANIAEDRHHIRRRAVHERAGDTQEGSIEVALSRLRWAGIAPKTISQTLAGSYVAPVLTAHPTEVQRKSILDAEHDIARLLAERDLPLTPKESAANLHLLRARVATLWQTRMLRYSKLTVADEIENALSYYRITFLRELPGLYDDIEADIVAQYGGGDGGDIVRCRLDGTGLERIAT